MPYLIDLLKSPSGFSKDPWRYFWNQVGHAYLVGLGLILVGVPVWVVLVGYALWETVQWIWFKAQAWDCVEDFLHVMLLALAAHYQLPLLVVIQMLLLLSGFLKRKEEAKK